MLATVVGHRCLYTQLRRATFEPMRLIFISRDQYGYHAGPGLVIPSETRLHPADTNRRVPAGNTVRAP